jgi:hypothetical protein
MADEDLHSYGAVCHEEVVDCATPLTMSLTADTFERCDVNDRKPNGGGCHRL